MRANLLVVLVVCILAAKVHGMPPPPPEQDPNNLSPTSQRKRAIEPASAPCRKKRSMKNTDGNVPGDRRFFPYDVYDPLCVYDHPIEIVKINSLTIRDGVILDNDIITKDMVK